MSVIWTSRTRRRRAPDRVTGLRAGSELFYGLRHLIWPTHGAMVDLVTGVTMTPVNGAHVGPSSDPNFRYASVTDGVNDYFTMQIPGGPITLAADASTNPNWPLVWATSFRADSIQADKRVVSLENAGPSFITTVEIESDGAIDAFGNTIPGGAGTYSANQTANVFRAYQERAAGTFARNYQWVDGVADAEGSFNVHSIPNLNRIVLGCMQRTTPIAFYAGQIYYTALWEQPNVAAEQNPTPLGGAFYDLQMSESGCGILDVLEGSTRTYSIPEDAGGAGINPAVALYHNRHHNRAA